MNEKIKTTLKWGVGISTVVGLGYLGYRIYQEYKLAIKNAEEERAEIEEKLNSSIAEHDKVVDDLKNIARKEREEKKELLSELDLKENGDIQPDGHYEENAEFAEMREQRKTFKEVREESEKSYSIWESHPERVPHFVHKAVKEYEEIGGVSDMLKYEQQTYWQDYVAERISEIARESIPYINDASTTSGLGVFLNPDTKEELLNRIEELFEINNVDIVRAYNEDDLEHLENAFQPRLEYFNDLYENNGIPAEEYELFTEDIRITFAELLLYFAEKYREDLEGEVDTSELAFIKMMLHHTGLYEKKDPETEFFIINQMMSHRLYYKIHTSGTYRVGSFGLVVIDYDDVEDNTGDTITFTHEYGECIQRIFDHIEENDMEEVFSEEDED